MRRVLVVLALAALLGPWVEIAGADPGIGITPGRIEVDDSLKPGGRYNLPYVGVTNTGDVTQEYRVTLRHYEDGSSQRIPSAWIRLEPRKFELEPGEHRSIAVNVEIPGNAEPGEYLALLEAQMGAGQAISGGVATTLSFSVGESGWLETLRRQVATWLDDASPWPHVLAIGSIGMLALRWSSKRIRFRLPFEPR